MAEGPLAKFDPTGENVDPLTFEQILEMDDDEDDRDFSKSIVYGFFDQADNSFQKMDHALKDKDLQALSQLGHFLKGSSATLGLTKVKDSCEKIQHYGQCKDENGNASDHDPEYFLDLIDKTTRRVKQDYQTAARVLRRFYKEDI